MGSQDFMKLENLEEAEQGLEIQLGNEDGSKGQEDNGSTKSSTPKGTTLGPFSLPFSPKGRKNSSLKGTDANSMDDEEISKIKASIIASTQSKKPAKILCIDTEVLKCSIFWFLWWGVTLTLLYMKIIDDMSKSV